MNYCGFYDAKKSVCKYYSQQEPEPCRFIGNNDNPNTCLVHYLGIKSVFGRLMEIREIKKM